MKLSIITVCYNAENSIRRTIESVLRQSVPVYEYIIIDGASSDSTLQIVEEYKIKFEKKGVLYSWISEEDKGISDAFNKGISLATGDVIGLINSDDELIENTCAILGNAYQDNIDIYYGNCLWKDETKAETIEKKPKHDLKRLLYYMILYHPSTFVKRSVYNECGMYDVTYKYCMDKHFLYRCYCNGKDFFYINECLTIFKAGGVSDTNAKRVFKEGSRMALEFEEPRVKVWFIEKKKVCRYLIVKILKTTGIYRFIKRI